MMNGVWCVCSVVFLVYLGCVSTCFFISTFYHVFRNHSVRAYANWLIADINGVGTVSPALVRARAVRVSCVCACACVCVCRACVVRPSARLL
jgi:predicted membrane channel-forming protein YqfA (hemolysin III family)